MKNYLVTIIVSLAVVAGIVMGFVSGFNMSQLQLKTLMIVGIVCASSALYCFVVGEVTGNNSQMDKLWSILPIAYAWIIAGMGGMSPRLIVMASLITIWGVRLTYNFAKKGAYSIKFWSGEEDYRWKIVRENKAFDKKWKWALFDLLFISIYQNALVLGICLPMLAVMDTIGFTWLDYVAAGLVAFFIIYETIADSQQMRFQTKKWDMIKAGQKLEDLPQPYNIGFNTTGLWSVSRHPNYLSEQSIWICLYIFVIASGIAIYGIFNWTIIPCLLLILLFMGSSNLAEQISASKYPLYVDYQEKVFKYLPLKKYKN